MSPLQSQPVKASGRRRRSRVAQFRTLYLLAKSDWGIKAESLLSLHGSQPNRRVETFASVSTLLRSRKLDHKYAMRRTLGLLQGSQSPDCMTPSQQAAAVPCAYAALSGEGRGVIRQVLLYRVKPTLDAFFGDILSEWLITGHIFGYLSLMGQTNRWSFILLQY